MPVSHGITITKFGELQTPISDKQAKELMKICSPAPFGLEYKTIIDKKVRDTYQLNPSQIKITNPEWNRQLDVLVERVSKELGCNGKLNFKIIFFNS